MSKRKFSVQEVSEAAQEALDNWDLEQWEKRVEGAADVLEGIRDNTISFTGGENSLDLDECDDRPDRLSHRPRWRDIWHWLEETAETVAGCV